MTDITPDFNICLQRKDVSPILKHSYDLSKINTFLQEAYSINARIADLTHELRAIRPAYLSTTPPPRHNRRPAGSAGSHASANTAPTHLTDTDREAVDAQSKLLLRQLNSAITALSQAESVRFQTAESLALQKRSRSGFGAIGRWAAGGGVTARTTEEEREEAQRKAEAGFREGVVWFLQRRLEAAGALQSEMMEVRLGREVEKGKSVLYKSRGMRGAGFARDMGESGGMAGGEGGEGQSADDNGPAMDQEQQQLFAQENNAMLEHYQDQLSHVHQAERSILEISELHSTLHANLEQQNAHIEQLVQDSYMTEENVGKGNKELKRASERRSTAQAVFWGTVGFCSFLVVWDLVF